MPKNTKRFNKARDQLFDALNALNGLKITGTKLVQADGLTDSSNQPLSVHPVLKAPFENIASHWEDDFTDEPGNFKNATAIEKMLRAPLADSSPIKTSAKNKDKAKEAIEAYEAAVTKYMAAYNAVAADHGISPSSSSSLLSTIGTGISAAASYFTGSNATTTSTTKVGSNATSKKTKVKDEDEDENYSDASDMPRSLSETLTQIGGNNGENNTFIFYPNYESDSSQPPVLFVALEEDSANNQINYKFQIPSNWVNIPGATQAQIQTWFESVLSYETIDETTGVKTKRRLDGVGTGVGGTGAGALNVAPGNLTNATDNDVLTNGNPNPCQIVTFSIQNDNASFFDQQLSARQRHHSNAVSTLRLNLRITTFASNGFTFAKNGKNENILPAVQVNPFTGIVSVNLHLDNHDQADIQAWLGQQLTVVVDSKTTPPTTRNLSNALVNPVLDSTGAATTKHTVAIQFANRDDANLFIENLKAASKPRLAEGQVALEIGKLLAHRAGVDIAKATYNKQRLQHTVIIKVTPDNYQRILKLLESLYSPNGIPAEIRHSYVAPTGTDTEGTLTLTFADAAVLKPLIDNIKQNPSAGYPLPALAVATPPTKETILRDSLKASLDNIGDSLSAINLHNFHQLAYDTTAANNIVRFIAGTAGRNLYAQSRVGNKNYIVMKFRANDAFFSDAADGTPSEYRRRFAKFLQSQHMSLRVVASNPVGSHEISLTVEESEDGLNAARSFERALIEVKPAELKKQKAYNPVLDGSLRALRGLGYILVAPFLPIFVAASGLLDVWHATMSEKKSPSNAKGLGMDIVFQLRNLNAERNNSLYDPNGMLGQQVSEIVFPTNNFIIHMIERWQTFSLFDKENLSGKLLASDKGYMRYGFGPLLMLLNLPIDLLVSTISAVLRNVFGFDKDGAYELKAKRALTYVWTGFWLTAAAITFIGFLAAVVAGFIHLAGAQGFGFYTVFNPMRDIAGYIMANMILPVLEFPFATLIQGAGKLLYRSPGFEVTMIVVAAAAVVMALVAFVFIPLFKFFTADKTSSTSTVSTAPLLDDDKVPELAVLSKGAKDMPGVDPDTENAVKTSVQAVLPDPVVASSSSNKTVTASGAGIASGSSTTTPKLTNGGGPADPSKTSKKSGVVCD